MICCWLWRWSDWTELNLKMEWSKSLSVVSDSLWPYGLCSPWNSPGQNTWVGRLSFLQGIFPTQQSNPGLLHYRRILYQLSHKRSPWRWKRVAVIQRKYSVAGSWKKHTHTKASFSPWHSKRCRFEIH